MIDSKNSIGTGTALLSKQQITLIEKALQSIPDFGEIRLIVEKGNLRFLVIQKSYKALDVTDEDVERIEF